MTKFIVLACVIFAAHELTQKNMYLGAILFGWMAVHYSKRMAEWYVEASKYVEERKKIPGRADHLVIVWIAVILADIAS